MPSSATKLNLGNKENLLYLKEFQNKKESKEKRDVEVKWSKTLMQLEPGQFEKTRYGLPFLHRNATNALVQRFKYRRHSKNVKVLFYLRTLKYGHKFSVQNKDIYINSLEKHCLNWTFIEIFVQSRDIFMSKIFQSCRKFSNLVQNKKSLLRS